MKRKICWPLVDRMLTVCCPYVIRMLSVCCPYVVRLLAVCWSYVDRMLTVCWPFFDRLVTVCWPLPLFQGLWVAAEWLLPLGPRWGHGEALPHPPAGRGRVLYCAAHHLPHPAGAGGALQPGRGRFVRQPAQGLHTGRCHCPTLYGWEVVDG